MVFVSFEEQNNAHENSSYNDYAGLMSIGNDTEIVAINRPVTDFTAELQNEVDYMVMSDMEDSFDI
jgi:hypothetical protein